jgi:hypothetical protein
MSKEGQRYFGVSRFREWTAKLLVVKKQPRQESQSGGVNDRELQQVETQNANLLKTANIDNVASSLAAMILADSLRKGNSVEIPSLGITITKSDLGEGESTKPSI